MPIYVRQSGISGNGLLTQKAGDHGVEDKFVSIEVARFGLIEDPYPPRIGFVNPHLSGHEKIQTVEKRVDANSLTCAEFIGSGRHFNIFVLLLEAFDVIPEDALAIELPLT